MLDYLVTYEGVLSDYGDHIKADSFAYECIYSGLTGLVKSDPEKTRLFERGLVAEYEVRKSDFIGRAAGAILAERLASIGLGGLYELGKFEKNEIRFQAERMLLTSLAKSGAADSSGAISFFLSEESSLGAERSVAVGLIGKAFTAHPSETSEAVFDAPKGAKRDAAIVQMVVRMNRNDPEAAHAWIDEISDPALRRSAKDDFESESPLSLRHLPDPTGELDPFAEPN